MTISFEGRVAIVTGAGGGIGRAYALELAKRGAKVVVNDLGGARDGTGHSDMALKEVEEIEAMGGEAMSNGGSVTEYEQMEKMVADAKEGLGGRAKHVWLSDHWKDYYEVVPVTAGIATLERVEILSGLKGTEKVALEDPTKKKVEKDDDN